MKHPRIALIHATPVAIDPIVDAFRRLWPEAGTTNLLEDGLALDLAADGRLTERMIERFVTLSRYVHSCGADAILFTCSAFGPAIEAAARAVPVPVLKPNEAMLDEALAAGTHIGLVATFEPTIPALKAELESMARAKQRPIRVTTSMVPDAAVALRSGDADRHDHLIASAADGLTSCNVLVLGQFSMASAARLIPRRPGCPVLTSPDSAVMRLRQALRL